MLENESRRQLVSAVVQGLCANPNTAYASASDMARRALEIVFELERHAPKGN